MGRDSGKIKRVIIVYLVEALWLVGQGLAVPIAISTLVTYHNIDI